MNTESLYYLSATLDTLAPGSSEARSRIIAVASALAFEAVALVADAAGDAEPELAELAEAAVDALAELQQRAFEAVPIPALSQ